MSSVRTYAPILIVVLLAFLAGCQDAFVDADAPAPEQAVLAKMQQQIAETGMYLVPPEEYALFGITLPDLEAEAGKNTVCDRADVPFPAGTLRARSCATVDLVQFQGGLYHQVTARAANGVIFSTDAIPVPRESKVCSVTLRHEGSFIAENDCEAEPHSYYASNAFALLIPASDGPYHFTRSSQHTWQIGAQFYAATTDVTFRVIPVP